MIPSIIEVVSYTSIICMILLYGTMHYDQPDAFSYSHAFPFNYDNDIILEACK
jgi:hypothetical protein